MKTVSVILIVVYLVFPVICPGPSWGASFAPAGQGAAVSGDSGGYPANHDTDNGETTLCCAGHLPISSFAGIPRVELASRLLLYEPRPALPQIVDRIVVPPQNHS